VSFIFCIFAGIHLAGGATILSGARILDGTGRATVENGAIVFEGTRILSIGPANSVPRPPNSEVIDAHGKTIIPGLISAHSHLGLCQGVVGPKPENYTRENVQQQLEQYERYGVLTVMSLGVNKDILYEWRNEQREGKFGGADIFTADRGLGVRLGAPPFPLSGRSGLSAEQRRGSSGGRQSLCGAPPGHDQDLGGRFIRYLTENGTRNLS
jgi:hypothetical protein